LAQHVYGFPPLLAGGLLFGFRHHGDSASRLGFAGISPAAMYVGLGLVAD